MLDEDTKKEHGYMLDVDTKKEHGYMLDAKTFDETCFQRGCVVASCVVAGNPRDYQNREHDKLHESVNTLMRVHLSMYSFQDDCIHWVIGTPDMQEIYRVIGTPGMQQLFISKGMGTPGLQMSQRMGTSGNQMATAVYNSQEKNLPAIGALGLSQRLGLYRHVVRHVLLQFLYAFLTVFGHMFMSVVSKQQKPEQQTNMLFKRKQAFLACCRRGKRSWRKHAQNKWHVRKAQRARWMLAIVLLGEFQLAKAMTSEQVAELLTHVGEIARGRVLAVPLELAVQSERWRLLQKCSGILTNFLG